MEGSCLELARICQRYVLFIRLFGHLLEHALVSLVLVLLEVVLLALLLVQQLLLFGSEWLT